MEVLVVEHRKAKAFLGLEDPAQITAARANFKQFDFGSLYRSFGSERLERSAAVEQLERLERSHVFPEH